MMVKIKTIPYINKAGKKVYYFIDGKSGKKINAGTIAEVSEERARILMGENSLGIKFAEIYTEPEETLEEKTREEIEAIAKKLDIKFPKNIKTINLINKIIEKQNS